jgi:hypothetical protein
MPRRTSFGGAGFGAAVGAATVAAGRGAARSERNRSLSIADSAADMRESSLSNMGMGAAGSLKLSPDTAAVPDQLQAPSEANTLMAVTHQSKRSSRRLFMMRIWER